MTEAATRRSVWSETYDAEVKDVFDVQEDIARRVVGAAAVKLTRFERDRALVKPTESLAAYEYVLRGRENFLRATRDSNDDAQDMFQRAIDLDPSYAAAYAELGLSLIEAVGSGWTEFIADDLARAETLAQKALSLDSASTAAYRLLAEVDLNRRRFDLALGQIDHALEINPSDAESFSTRGNILLFAGRAAEALPWLESALRLDSANARATFLLGTAYYFLDRYSECVEAMDRALAGNLGRNIQFTGRSVLAAAYAQLDRGPDAQRERRAVMRIAPFLDAERAALKEMVRVLMPKGTLLIANLNSFITSCSGGWIKDQHGRYLHYPVDRYLEEFPEWVEWSGIRIENWHRPLSRYIRELLAQGLTLTFFDEPQPQSGDDDRRARYHRAPWFIVMEWQR